MRFFPYLVLPLCLLSGCAIFGDEQEDETADWSAEQLFTEAKDALNSEYYSKAIEHYEKLLARYPFGVYAQQGQLDLAYAYYKNDDTASAVAACERFIKLNPDHPHVDYAYYLKGLANFQQGKGLTERFLPIDPSQRDQAAALKAFQDFSELVQRFKQSRYVKDARMRMMHLRNILAQHEVNVAHYYMRRGAYVAAANRARYVVENYQRAPAMPEALMLMTKAYRVLELDALADDAMRVLELNYPDYQGVEEVRGVSLRE